MLAFTALGLAGNVPIIPQQETVVARRERRALIVGLVGRVIHSVGRESGCESEKRL